MTIALHPFQLLVIALAGWLSRHQQAFIDYLIEENRVLKDQLDGHRLRFTDEQRIRLAVKVGSSPSSEKIQKNPVKYFFCLWLNSYCNLN